LFDGTDGSYETTKTMPGYKIMAGLMTTLDIGDIVDKDGSKVGNGKTLDVDYRYYIDVRGSIVADEAEVTIRKGDVKITIENLAE
jgi:hypothetical protein